MDFGYSWLLSTSYHICCFVQHPQILPSWKILFNKTKQNSPHPRQNHRVLKFQCKKLLCCAYSLPVSVFSIPYKYLFFSSLSDKPHKKSLSNLAIRWPGFFSSIYYFLTGTDIFPFVFISELSYPLPSAPPFLLEPKSQNLRLRNAYLNH